MSNSQPVPADPAIAPHLAEAIAENIEARTAPYLRHGAELLVLWALLHPLPSGARPIDLQAVADRLHDRDGLWREIAAVTAETGVEHQQLGMRVKRLQVDATTFTNVAFMAAEAVDAFIRSGLSPYPLDTAPIERKPVAPDLLKTLDSDLPF